MNTIEIKDEEINVEEIVSKIRENIKKRRESGAYTKEMEEMIKQPLQAPAIITGNDVMQKNLDYINSNWDLNVEYHISSHRPILGRLLIWGRRLVNREVKRYVDLISGRQSEFNAHVVRSVNAIDSKINNAATILKKDIDTKIDVANKDIDTKIDVANKEIDTKIDAINKDIDTRLNKAVVNEVNDMMFAINKDIENKAWLANVLDNRIKRNMITSFPDEVDGSMNYFLFEEKFRGSTKDIKQRQSIYVEYFKNCRNVLDIGCGRGEFLSLMKESGTGAKGIDMNEDMVLFCKKNELDVSQNDALSYLNTMSDKSLDGIFSAQVVEHLQPSELINMVKISYDKLQFGSYFIAETINPMCIMASQWFYLDLSHVRLIHPDTIKFIMESVGFRDIEFKFFSPVPDDLKLKKLDLSKETGNARVKIELINQNIEKLNQFLYGNQDYAVIGKK